MKRDGTKAAYTFAFLLAALTFTGAGALAPEGIVYESEAISQPDSAWALNERTADRWMLWTREDDIESKRSGGAVLASPMVEADRESPEEGAPPLHSVVTDLEPGAYLVYVSNPGGRPLAYSVDGKTWFKHVGTEVALGVCEVRDGRFELWVDDRYAHPSSNPGPGYYDYVRFVPVPASAMRVERHESFPRLDAWLEENDRGFAVPATDTTDWVGFEAEGEARQRAAEIGGPLTCAGGRFVNPGACAIDANSALIEGSFLLT